jgi:hypothetical protein
MFLGVVHFQKELRTVFSGDFEELFGLLGRIISGFSDPTYANKQENMYYQA